MKHRSLRIHPLVRTLTAVLIAASALMATSIASEASAGGSRTIWVPLYRQIYGLDCEAAAIQMALGHEGIRVSQNALLNAMHVDRRAPTTDATGFHWGNPNTNFVGNPNGSERLHTGYGTYATPASRAARTYGGRVLAFGTGISPNWVYGALLRGHPVVVWVAFDWRFHQVSHYVAFDGQTVAFGSPYEHAVTLYGVRPGYVLVNNPWHGVRQWIPKWQFQRAYATFGNMAVIFN
jgi:uncharacterized protein YvpB